MSTTEGIDERRRILEMVAEGKVTAAEGARLLEALKGPLPGDRDSTAPKAEPRSDFSEERVDSVRILGTFRALRIEGDPSIKGAVATGRHRVSRRNGVLVFEEDPDDDEESGFTLFGPARGRNVHFQGNWGGKGFTWGGDRRPPVLEIRMNPELPLEVEMTAGSAKVWGVKGPIKASLTAGSGRFEGIHSPIALAVDAGSVIVSGTFDQGSSDIRCTAGKVRVILDRSSDVKITARASLGKIKLPNGPDENFWAIGAGKKETVIGSGKASLDIEATTGAVIVDMQDE